MSPELTRITSSFRDIDPETMSINGSYEAISKRVWWQNALGYLIHIISCSLIAKNSELDRTTSKIALIAKDFFRANLRPEQDALIEVHFTLRKLETIITLNQGSKYSEVHSLANRALRILNGEDVEPMAHDPKESLVSLLTRSAALPLVANKVKELISNERTVELFAGFSEVKDDEDLFLSLFYAALHYSPSSVWSVNLIQDIEWPSEDMKLATQESYLQDPDGVSPPSITTLVQKWLIPAQGEWLTANQLAESQKVQKMIQKRIVSLLLYEDYQELCDAFSLISNNELKFASLIGLLKINDMAAFIKIMPLLQTLEWPSDELRATLLSID